MNQRTSSISRYLRSALVFNLNATAPSLITSLPWPMKICASSKSSAGRAAVRTHLKMKGPGPGGTAGRPPGLGGGTLGTNEGIANETIEDRKLEKV
jgi:hypothetical protein